MTWLNGRKPPYMESAEYIELTAAQVSKAAFALTYEGARVAAAAFFMLANRQGLSPDYISKVIETEPDESPVKIKEFI